MASAYKALPVSAALTEVGPNTQTSAFDLATTLNAAGLIINDTIDFIAIPPGALLTRIVFDLCQVDSNVAPLLVLDIGTDLTVAQGGVDIGAGLGFFAGSTAGRSANYNVISEESDSSYQHGSLPFTCNIDKSFIGLLLKNAMLRMKVRTAPATATVAGKIFCTAEWTMTNDAGLL